MGEGRDTVERARDRGRWKMVEAPQKKEKKRRAWRESETTEGREGEGKRIVPVEPEKERVYGEKREGQGGR